MLVVLVDVVLVDVVELDVLVVDVLVEIDVLVLDDVEEKLSRVEAEKLPTPSWILETSPGSERLYR